MTEQAQQTSIDQEIRGEERRGEEIGLH